ncbi:MAG: site-specific integrase [Candidatus Nanoarchaeia archaeon]
MPTTTLPQNPTTDDKTFNPFSQKKFEEYLQRTYTNKYTQYQYRLFFRRLQPFLDEGNITQNTINKFLTTISANKSYGNPLYLGALKAVERCFKDEFRKLNLEVEIPKVRSARPYKPKPKFIPYTEVAEIVRNIKNLQLKLMVRLYFETGLRSSELTRTSINNINMKKRTISGIGKWNQPFTVKYSPQSGKWLSQWLLKARDTTMPFLLYGQGTRPLRNQVRALNYYLQKECKRMGKEGIHIHRFRHALGYFLRAEKGFDIVEVKTKLRHRSIVSTEIYAPAPQEEVDKKIDREIYGVQESSEESLEERL